MKKVVIGVVVLVTGVSLWAAADKDAMGALPEVASGHGSVTWHDQHNKEQGVGMLTFDVARHGRIIGSLVFAAEHGHDFPDVVLRLDNVAMLQFTPDTVRFAGIGLLIDEPVFITVYGYDGASIRQPDTFSITAVDINGEQVFEAEGEMLFGSLVVGEPQ